LHISSRARQVHQVGLRAPFVLWGRTDWLEDALASVERQSINLHTDDDAAHDDLLAREPQWAAWKVAVVMAVCCTAFWSGVGYIATRLLG
jgi:hypothetical protein